MHFKKSSVFQSLLAINLALFIIFLSIELALLFKPLYYFDIWYLGIDKIAGISTARIVENYNYMIQYLVDPRPQSFKLPSLPYSVRGQIHFGDVKRIFTSIELLFIITGLVSVAGLYCGIKHGMISVLKKASFILLFFIIVTLTAFTLNFDASFTLFHKAFFRNNYWLFDPVTDPVIMILPEAFFLHAALFILMWIVIGMILLSVCHRKLLKKWKNKSVF
ncbi:TIGR01906 family membrane protein [Sporolactobacillus inulinus]|uniref:Membrane protein n=1 Tax=Sporolactobacillus inulinus CASD TaxID=1069536 RepID=A0A0U1QM91_9BACL|nr:TIGR01906 family membrane protein [Sporolactobacillus inulinus]KLI01919.1 membrane protein [Sporolactobacillus inulinus CASD]GEB76743.1 membrane protein [Sporolactobacillus inulinus]